MDKKAREEYKQNFLNISFIQKKNRRKNKKKKIDEMRKKLKWYT